MKGAISEAVDACLSRGAASQYSDLTPVFWVFCGLAPAVYAVRLPKPTDPS